MLAFASQSLIDRAMLTELTPATLKNELEKYGRSQAALARHLNLDSSAVNRMVSGQRQIKAKELQKILEYLQSTDLASHDKPAATKSISKETESILRNMSVGHSGDLRQIVIVSFFSIFGNLRLGITKALGPYAPTEDDAEQFWQMMLQNPEAQLMMGLGAGLLPPAEAPRVRALIQLVRMTTRLGEDEKLEDDPEAIRLAYQTLPYHLPKPATPEDLRAQVALYLSSIALLVLGPNADAVQELQNMFQSLDPAAQDLPPTG